MKLGESLSIVDCHVLDLDQMDYQERLIDINRVRCEMHISKV